MSATVANGGAAEEADQDAWGRTDWLFLILLLAMPIELHAGLLFGAAGPVISCQDTDLEMFFYTWREFGFSELRHGVIPFWNPHLFGGQPYMSGFQSALFYPFNWLYALLPFPRVVNVDVTIHLVLAGWLMYIWMRVRHMLPVAAAVAAITFMFGGVLYLHVFAGHLTILSSAVWAPLLFAAIDRWYERREPASLLFGGIAIGMQILGGHPQYLFYTGIGAGLYAIWNQWERRRPWHWFSGFCGMNLIGIGIGMVQLLPGILTDLETVRSGKVTYDFASTFSFPPENLITFLVPGFFGGLSVSLPYWGRCTFWEMCGFGGITSLLLGVTAVLSPPAPGVSRFRRWPWGLLLLAGITLLLAMGSHLPWFRFMYDWLPGFAKFRGNSKFIFLCAMFMAALGAAGADALWRQPRLGIIPARIAWCMAGITAGLGLLLYSFNGGGCSLELWNRFVAFVRDTREVTLPPTFFSDPEIFARCASVSALHLLISSATCLIVGLLLHISVKRSHLLPLLAVFAFAEIFIFASMCREQFTPNLEQLDSVRQLLLSAKSDDRILCPEPTNAAMALRLADIAGYDTGPLKRYAEFIAFTQELPVSEVNQYFQVKQYHPLLALIRFAHIVQPKEDGTFARFDLPPALPALFAVYHWDVVPDGRDAIFKRMGRKEFPLRERVILEKPLDGDIIPSADSASTTPASIHVLARSVNHQELDVEMPADGLLIAGDNFCSGWRAISLPGSSQDHYQIFPADYILQAVPLRRGRHHLEIRYRPPGWEIAPWISLSCILIVMTLFCIPAARCRVFQSLPLSASDSIGPAV
ncbi:MAG: YfhO family protein [Candidatus Riflebacteria bacterium]|nr:YfhO family protein [Candidatus Riflebacteria bacterium]